MKQNLNMRINSQQLLYIYLPSKFLIEFIEFKDQYLNTSLLIYSDHKYTNFYMRA